jgi:hypothetical protein
MELCSQHQSFFNKFFASFFVVEICTRIRVYERDGIVGVISAQVQWDQQLLEIYEEEVVPCESSDLGRFRTFVFFIKKYTKSIKKTKLIDFFNIDEPSDLGCFQTFGYEC